jgi:hypothetical protein
MLAGKCEVDVGCGRYVIDYVMNEFSRKIGEKTRAVGIGCVEVAHVGWVGRE